MTFSSGLRVMLFETRTGKITNNAVPFLRLPTFTRLLNQSGSIDLTLQLGDNSLVSAAELRPQLAAYRYSVAVCYDNTILQAGPIVSLYGDDSNQVITVKCGDMWNIFKQRIVINPSLPPTPTTSSSLMPVDSTRDSVYSNLALHDIAVHLVTDACARTGFNLPIDFPSDVGGTSTRTYKAFDLATVFERLTDIINVQNGPDVDFNPYFDNANPNYIRWQMRVGNPALSQPATSLYWDYGSSLISVKTDGNGSSLATGVYARGNATAEASLISYSVNSTLLNAGWPALEWVDNTHTSALEASTIQGYSDANISLYSATVETWDATISLSAIGGPTVADFLPGHMATFNMQGHFFVPDGVYVQRILGYSLAGVDTMKLVLQATQGAL